MSSRPHAFGFSVQPGCITVSELPITAYSSKLLRLPHAPAIGRCTTRSAHVLPLCLSRQTERHPFRREEAVQLRHEVVAADQVTESTGWFRPLKWLGLVPMIASHCACVTWYYRGVEGVLTSTLCSHISDAPMPLSPITKPPAGISTSSIRISWLEPTSICPSFLTIRAALAPQP